MKRLFVDEGCVSVSEHLPSAARPRVGSLTMQSQENKKENEYENENKNIQLE